jgi:hypothetical protein
MRRKNPEAEVTQSPDLDRRGGASVSIGERHGVVGTAVRQAWFIPAIAATVALILLALFWDRPITDDVAWYLMGTRDWLNGAVLYEMVVEVNPPLNFYFTVPAVLIADLLGVSDINGQYILTALMIFGSLLWCGTIIRNEFGLSPARQALLLIGIGAAMVIPALDSIGQREQSLVILMMPWLLGQVVGGPPTARVDVPRAVVAALGVCLKPHFILYPIAVTLVWMVRTRSLKPILAPANLVFLAVGLAYVAYVAAAHPAYLFDIVPMASQVYGAYKTDAGMLVAAVYPRVLLLLFPVLFALRDREVWTPPGPVIFGAVTLAALVSFWVQGTAFPYHLIPVSVFGMVACAIVLAKAKTFAPLCAAVVIAFVGLATLGLRQGFPKHPVINHLDAVADQVGKFDSFIALSSSLFAGPPVHMATGAEWVSRYPANWLVPGAVEELGKTDCAVEPDRCAALRAIGARNRSDNIADMVRTEPDLLIVELDPGFFPAPRFDWLAFMNEDPAWAGVFRHYKEVARTAGFRFFRRDGG